MCSLKRNLLKFKPQEFEKGGIALLIFMFIQLIYLNSPLQKVSQLIYFDSARVVVHWRTVIG